MAILLVAVWKLCVLLLVLHRFVSSILLLDCFTGFMGVPCAISTSCCHRHLSQLLLFFLLLRSLSCYSIMLTILLPVLWEFTWRQIKLEFGKSTWLCATEDTQGQLLICPSHFAYHIPAFFFDILEINLETMNIIKHFWLECNQITFGDRYCSIQATPLWVVRHRWYPWDELREQCLPQDMWCLQLYGNEE